MMLRENSRITNQDIAKEVNLTNQAVRYRITNLEKNHVILSYPLLLDKTKMGINFTGGIKLKIEPQKLEQIVKELSTRKDVLWTGEVSGGFGLSILVETTDRFAFRNSLREISAVDGVTSYISYIYVGAHGKYFI
jgi:DNA-binding Lrp family transcriptional regulator